jgi:predicted O-linked N-acetylglucosamine transferase (SPINDLY family)
MGVPVLTVSGDRIAGRHATAHLRTVGLADCVAADEADLVARAATLLRDPARLAEWRSTLRDRVAASPLVDAAGFAAAFVDLVEATWDATVEGRG